GADGVGKSA
nr:Chain C, 9-mer peptide [Homo sapiens]6ULI_C Chain C, GLY-ALA-ASP-GLY-VAL-GLY-LYS-SER-ALA [Homo sapiens]6ULN_C Chain C, GLY-ALA-ASP-GLY-VAL-GLY-LYS-SER-ALA [Homo sapiens]6ULR_C Chain C, GLY-ALA-ASP-GLY-VAL-GLY-LYS-SER-ALA [Homo sapiens]